MYSFLTLQITQEHSAKLTNIYLTVSAKSSTAPSTQQKMHAASCNEYRYANSWNYWKMAI